MFIGQKLLEEDNAGIALLNHRTQLFGGAVVVEIVRERGVFHGWILDLIIAGSLSTFYPQIPELNFLDRHTDLNGRFGYYRRTHFYC